MPNFLQENPLSSFNSGSQFYQGIMGQDWAKKLKSDFSSIGKSTGFNLKLGSDLGNLFSTGEKMSRDTKTGIDNLKDFNTDTIGGGGDGSSKFNFGNALNIAGTMASIGKSFLPEKSAYSGKYGNQTRMYDNLYDSAKSVAYNINPLVGAGMEVAGFVGDGINALTGGTDGMTKADAFLDSTIGSTVLAPLSIVNSLGAKKADTITKDTDVFSKVGDAYTGTEKKVDDMSEYSGKNFGLVSRGKLKEVNKDIGIANLQQEGARKISNNAQIAFAGANNPYISIGNQYKRIGGYQQSNSTATGKNGMKLDRDFAKRVVKLSKGKKNKEVAEFKNGGAVNVIPDGALHKNKHHLENVDEKFEDVTAKGIPVITESEGGDITQHAEVEREEIIFNLDVTKQLEKLMEDGSDDAAIEAGKLLVHEILENTIDNAGIMDKV